MSGLFAPDDDRDPEEDDSGWRSMREYIRDRQHDIKMPNDQDHIDPTRIDVDPDLFGEFRDGEIEVRDGKQSEWNREITLIQLTGACPACDSEIETDTVRDIRDKITTDIFCPDCESQWIVDGRI